MTQYPEESSIQLLTHIRENCVPISKIREMHISECIKVKFYDIDETVLVHYGAGVDSASNRNEFQESSWV
jgi:hypothetical protein